MLKKKLLVAALASSFALPVLAADAPYTVASNIGFVSNYIFRGITQNVAKPAVQGGIDLTLANGFYAGVWGSNVGWITGSGSSGNASLELDTYAGYRGAFATDYSYDVGLIRYNYLGDYTPPAAAGSPTGAYAKADTAEAYGSIGYKWISAKYSYALSDFLTVPGAKGTSYIEVNANYAVGDSGFTLIAHYGKQKYKGAFADWLVATGFDPSYSDYKLGVTKDISGYVVGVAYTNTNAKSGGYYTFPNNGVNKDWGKSAVAVSLTHSF